MKKSSLKQAIEKQKKISASNNNIGKEAESSDILEKQTSVSK